MHQLEVECKIYDSVDKHVTFEFGIGNTDYYVSILQEELTQPDGFNKTVYHQITNIDAFFGHVKPRVRQPGINNTSKAPKDRVKRKKASHLKVVTPVPVLTYNVSKDGSVQSDSEHLYNLDVQNDSTNNDDSVASDDIIDLDGLESIMNAPANAAKYCMDCDQKLDPEVVKQHINNRLYTNQLTFSQVTHYKGCMDCQKTTPIHQGKPLFKHDKWAKGFQLTHMNTIDSKAVVVTDTPVGFMKTKPYCFRNSFNELL